MLFIYLSYFFVFIKSNDENIKVTKIPGNPDQPFFHFQSFENDRWKVHYIATQNPSSQGKWEVTNNNIAPNEKMLFTKSLNSQFYISSQFPSQLKLNNETLIIQFETKYNQPLRCNGAFIKLYSGQFNQKTANSSIPYTIKFGPDLCSKNRIHFDFTRQNKLTGELLEHHLAKDLIIYDDLPDFNHLFTLIIRNDNSFEIQVDSITYLHGNLLEDFTPPVNPPKLIDDPNDKKPSNFDDKEMIIDKSVKKPKDWDQPEFIVNPAKMTPPPNWLLNEPERIPDPTIKKPDSWDEEFFGKWEAPLIENPKCYFGCGYYTPPMMKNPEYKGRWKAPKIKNPGYKGKWVPRKIPNPNYYSDEDVHNFGPLSALSLETNSLTNRIGFNNILISTNESNTHKWNRLHYFVKYRYYHSMQRNLNLNKKIDVVYSKNHPINKETSMETNSKNENINQQENVDLKMLLINLWNSLSVQGKFITILILFVCIPVPIIVWILVICLRPKRRRRRKNHHQTHENKNE